MTISCDRARSRRGFTLIELLVVVTIIAILVGLSFPALNAAMRAAKKGQAKSESNNLVVALKNYYNEYGKYPISGNTDTDWGDGSTNNGDLMSVLMAGNATLNRKQIVFIEPPLADSPDRPGVFIDGTTIGDFNDPWGNPYYVRVDGNDDGQVVSPKDSSKQLFMGCVVWSAGVNGEYDTSAPPGGEINRDNVYSFE